MMIICGTYESYALMYIFNHEHECATYNDGHIMMLWYEEWLCILF